MRTLTCSACAYSGALPMWQSESIKITTSGGQFRVDKFCLWLLPDAHRGRVFQEVERTRRVDAVDVVVIAANDALAPGCHARDRPRTLDEVRAARITKAGAGVGLQIRYRRTGALAFRNALVLVVSRAVGVSFRVGGAVAHYREYLRLKVERIHLARSGQVCHRQPSHGCVEHNHTRVWEVILVERVVVRSRVARVVISRAADVA